MPDKYGILSHNFLQEGVESIFNSVCDWLEHFFSDAAILSVIIGDLDAWFEELVEYDFSLEVYHCGPGQLKTSLRDHHLTINDQNLVLELNLVGSIVELVEVRVDRVILAGVQVRF